MYVYVLFFIGMFKYVAVYLCRYQYKQYLPYEEKKKRVASACAILTEYQRYLRRGTKPNKKKMLKKKDKKERQKKKKKKKKLLDEQQYNSQTILSSPPQVTLHPQQEKF